MAETDFKHSINREIIIGFVNMGNEEVMFPTAVIEHW